MAQVDILENTVKFMSTKIEVLEDKLQNQRKEGYSTSKMDCKQCYYHASSTTELKRHIT